MNIIVIPNKTDLTTYIKYNVKSFIFGLKDFSVNYEEISLDELKDIRNKYPDIEIYLSINKTIFNKDLKVLESLLKEIDKLNIKGILFYDLSIIYLKKELNLKTDLVWHQTHFVTNYNTCNYFYDSGAKYGILSSEITVDEMIEIKNNTKMKLMVYLMGHSVVSHSRRKLLSNYFKFNNSSSTKEYYHIKDKAKGDSFIIYEDDNGTVICTSEILNGSNYVNKLLENNFKHFILDSKFIPDEVFFKVLDLFRELLESKNIDKEEIINKINTEIGGFTGFFNKKTIYKVKQ